MSSPTILAFVPAKFAVEAEIISREGDVFSATGGERRLPSGEVPHVDACK